MRTQKGRPRFSFCCCCYRVLARRFFIVSRRSCSSSVSTSRRQMNSTNEWRKGELMKKATKNSNTPTHTHTKRKRTSRKKNKRERKKKKTKKIFFLKKKTSQPAVRDRCDRSTRRVFKVRMDVPSEFT